MIVAGIFRGVKVRGGEHTLTMTYETAAFRIGAAISLLTFCMTLAGLYRWRHST